jgi:hypothetical protein
MSDMLENTLVIDLPAPADWLAPAPSCDCCGYATSVTPFAGKLACDPCVRAGMCKVCKSAWAVDGWDSCAQCEAAFLRVHPEEYDAEALSRTAAGREVMRLAGPKVRLLAAALELETQLRESA